MHSNNGCVARDDGVVGTTDASTDEDTLGRVTEDVLVEAISAISAREWGGGIPPRLMVGPPNEEAGDKMTYACTVEKIT